MGGGRMTWRVGVFEALDCWTSMALVGVGVFEALDCWMSLAFVDVGFFEALDGWASMALVGFGVLEALPFMNGEREKVISFYSFNKKTIRESQ